MHVDALRTTLLILSNHQLKIIHFEKPYLYAPLYGIHVQHYLLTHADTQSRSSEIYYKPLPPAGSPIIPHTRKII